MPRSTADPGVAPSRLRIRSSPEARPPAGSPARTREPLAGSLTRTPARVSRALRLDSMCCDRRPRPLQGCADANGGDDIGQHLERRTCLPRLAPWVRLWLDQWTAHRYARVGIDERELVRHIPFRNSSRRLIVQGQAQLTGRPG